MKVRLNKSPKGLLTYTEYIPVDTLDTFMACVAFSIYGTVKRRIAVRKKILLAHANVISFAHLIEQFFQDQVDSPTFAFVVDNWPEGVIVDKCAMCQAVANCFCVSVHLNSKIFRPAKKALGRLFLNYKDRTFRLRIPYGLETVRVKVMYSLLRFENDEWVRVGEMKRRNAIHKLTVEPKKANTMYTVMPIGECRIKNPLIVYSRTKAGCSVISMSGVFNPYFFLSAPADIFVVESDSRESADLLLQIENKITVI